MHGIATVFSMHELLPQPPAWPLGTEPGIECCHIMSAQVSCTGVDFRGLPMHMDGEKVLLATDRYNVQVGPESPFLLSFFLAFVLSFCPPLDRPAFLPHDVTRKHNRLSPSRAIRPRTPCRTTPDRCAAASLRPTIGRSSRCVAAPSRWASRQGYLTRLSGRPKCWCSTPTNCDCTTSAPEQIERGIL